MELAPVNVPPSSLSGDPASSQRHWRGRGTALRHPPTWGCCRPTGTPAG